MRTRSRVSRLSLGTILASALIIALPSAALSGDVIDTTVTLHIDQQDAIFKGKVMSSEDVCVIGRKVLLIRIEPDDSKTIVERAFANENGHYSAFIPMQHGNPYFAKVRRKTPGSVVCAADRSPTKIA
jgi:hypothetical protein